MTDQHQFHFRKLEGCPPDQVRILELRAEPYDDRRRIKVFLHVKPFSKAPDLHIEVQTLTGNVLAQLDIIETTEAAVVFTIHLKEPTDEIDLRLHAAILYAEQGIVDEAQANFQLPDE